MADQTDSSSAAKGTVQFKEDAIEKPYPMKHVPTQRYDRKEIQKRLDLENWMDNELKQLYDGDEVGGVIASHFSMSTNFALHVCVIHHTVFEEVVVS